MRFGVGWRAARGAALAGLLLAAVPAAAQQQQQQQPSPAGGGAAAEGAYATLLRDTEARFGRAIEQAQGGAGRGTQAGAMPPGQQQLMDATQAAWQAMQGGAPEEMRGGSGPYADADRTFRRAVEAMRVGNTPPDAALAAARDAHGALGKLREAAAAQGGGTAAGASAPSPGTSNQAPLQEPPRR